MMPTKDYIDALNQMQKAVNQDGPDGPGSPQTFDQAIVVRAAAIGETMRLTLHCLLEMREMMLLQCLAQGLIPKAAGEASNLAASSGETAADLGRDEGEDFGQGAGNYDADGNDEDERAPREPEFDPDNPPPENTPAWYGWRAEMNARGFTAVPVNEVAADLTEAELTDPALIKERMDKLAGLP